MRLYVSQPEARELLGGTVPQTVVDKLATQLELPPPIDGQTDIYDHLEEPCEQRPATHE